MIAMNVTEDNWLKEISEGDIDVTIGYVEIKGDKGSKLLLSNSFGGYGSHTMAQFWDFKSLEGSSIVKGGNQGDIRSIVLFTRTGDGFTEYYLVGYLNNDVDYWTMEIPTENYFYSKVQ
jgi:hypothetical protein